MLRLKSVGAILLALSFLFNRAQGDPSESERIVIGYRTVDPVEAEEINEDNKPTRDPWYDGARAHINQLGDGLYLTQKPASWAGHELVRYSG
ncbi:uncharacterized protein L3040_001450 [Drepanopeziza brunnea f. sp. 'multigermtubi']|uniref:uncharacterized protein n=1 Tax=Drepanopeziza brunnea f. sp. 'multigermtubi' TaxID=698441 RepID=UPI00239E2A76|nr:hypothetical protein L3040_001450 [Drepanopeziza brunnea f. sp. 'multigermtubi']